MNAAHSAIEQSPLAIVCGGGSLPLAVAESVSKRGRRVVLFMVRGAPDAGAVGNFTHYRLHVGQIGKFLRLARAAGCREVVFIGSLVRPSLWQVHLDFRGLMLLPKVIAAYRGGDDHLLSGMAKLIEGEGLRLRGAHEVAPEILVPEGALGRVLPSDRDRADMALGFEYLRATGAFDVGQAIVVAGRHVLTVEAAEGTDHMLARVAEMRTNGRVRSAAGIGVLVKGPKTKQDQRFDLPSIGPRTVEGVRRAGLAGIAVVAGATIMADPERLVAAADSGGIFVFGAALGSGP
jgi:hypothetical protein